MGTGVGTDVIGEGSSLRRRSPSVTGSSISKGGVGPFLVDESALGGTILIVLLEDLGVFANRRSSLCSLAVFKIGLVDKTRAGVESELP